LPLNRQQGGGSVSPKPSIGKDIRHEQPRIAAIIPLCNGAKYIGESLRSVFTQNLPPSEIVVVDDGSTDEGPQIVEDLASTHPVRLLRKQNGGQASARNFGIDHTTSELIALLDQDDLWYPNHLEQLIQPFLTTPETELGWVYSNLDEIDEAGKLVSRAILPSDDGQHPKRTLTGCLRQDMFVLPSASLISRRAFDMVGGFDEELRGYEDDDLFLRMFYKGLGNVFLDMPLSQWRMHRDSSAYSPRMAKSRMIYARKLLAAFPDDPEKNLFYARDLIAPRFYPQMVAECREALRSGDRDGIEVSCNNLRVIGGFLSSQSRARADAGWLITAIIPLYNGAPYIEQAIRSVLGQTLLPAELIVVDDGSTDQGAQIVERIAAGRRADVPIKLLRKINGGQSSARNFGAQHASGDLIAFLDQDDLWYPNHLDRLIQPFLTRSDTELGWVYSNLDEIDENGNLITRSCLSTVGTPHPKRSLFECLREDMFVLPSASLISRAAFRVAGGFDERLTGYEDDDLFLRLFRCGFHNVYLNEGLSQWRIYTTSASYSPRMARSRMIYAKKLLDEFPDEPERGRYVSRDLVAPRFFAHMVGEYRRTLQRGDQGQTKAALNNLRFMSKYLRLRFRVILTVLLPLLKYQVLARGLLAARDVLQPVVRWMLRTRVAPAHVNALRYSRGGAATVSAP
jgi:glycosyltransferase involved in cell wall biosynthesis